MAKWDEDELDRVYYDDISVVSFGKDILNICQNIPIN